MRENLPVLRSESTPELIRERGQSGMVSSLSSWIGSPVGRAIAQVLPDVIRMANRSKPAESRPLVSQILPSSDGASGLTLSEVEVDLDVPFIHRVTIRSASSWSVAPDVLLAERQKEKRGRWKLRALAAGALGVAGVILARKNGVSLPGRLNPAASLPFLTSSTSSLGSTSTEKNPGAAK
jgi:hypothetical protein